MKRFWIIILEVCFSLFASAQDSNTVLVGDMNGDGVLTVTDADILSNVVLGKTRRSYISTEYITVELGSGTLPSKQQSSIRHLKGDMDNDGNITIVDVTRLFNVLLGNDEASYLPYDVVYDTLGIKNGHEYVDLGLSVKWATMNVGATSFEEYGGYFAWAETEDKSYFKWNNYEWGTSSSALSKYNMNKSRGNVDNLVTIDVSDDAARIKWGGDWRIPTYDDFGELRSNCFWVWTDNYNDTGVSGYIVYKAKADADKGMFNNKKSSYSTSSYSLADTHIFLPRSGYRSSVTFYEALGCYWTSSIYTSSCDEAYGFYFDSESVYRDYFNRYLGLTIRAVRP